MFSGFSSLRLAFVLLTVLAVLIILSAIIPQKGIAVGQMADWQEILGDNYRIIETLGLDRIYYSPLFFIVLGLLALNLIWGNLKRFRLIFRSRRNIFRLRHLGSIIFHLSLIMIMCGVILNYLYKFEGIFALTEGQSTVDSPNSYFREYSGPLYESDYNRFSLTLEKVNPAVGEGEAVGVEITVQPAGNNVPLKSIVMTNNPLKMADLEIHYGMFKGYSPEVIISVAAKPLLSGFIRLATQITETGERWADFVLLPDKGMKVGVDVIEGKNGSLDFKIDVERGGQTIYDGTMILGDSVRFDEYVISIPRMRRWCYIDVVESPFLGLVFFGFWSALTGMLISFLARIRGEGGK